MTSTPRRRKGLIVAIIIIALSILCAVGALLWQHLQPKPLTPSNNNPVTSQDEPAPQPELPDPYIGWNTYASQRDGYEIKYPPEWIVISETPNDGPYIRNMQFTGGGYPEGYINLRILRDEGVVAGSNLSPKAWYAKLGVESVTKGPVTFTPDTVEKYRFNGFESKKAKSIFTEIDEDIFLLRGDVLYEINMYPYGISENDEVQKILNSFKFI